MTTRARREREKEERRQSILRAAREVFFDKGFQRATVDEVAERAEVSKGTVYLYFESKETLLAHLLLDGLDALIEALERDGAPDGAVPADERLRRLGWAYLCFFEQEPQYFRLLMAMDRGRFQETVTPQVYQEVLRSSLIGLDFAVQAIAQGVEDGVFRPCEPGHAGAVLWAALNGLLELAGSPLRQQMIGVECQVLYQVALSTFIQGLRMVPIVRKEVCT